MNFWGINDFKKEYPFGKTFPYYQKLFICFLNLSFLLFMIVSHTDQFYDDLVKLTSCCYCNQSPFKNLYFCCQNPKSLFSAFPRGFSNKFYLALGSMHLFTRLHLDYLNKKTIPEQIWGSESVFIALGDVLDEYKYVWAVKLLIF